MSELFECLTDAVMQEIQPERRVDQPERLDRLEVPDAQDDPTLSKREYVASRLEKLRGEAERTLRVALNYVEQYPVSRGNQRAFDVEELIWKDAPHPEISKRIRRDVAESIKDVPVCTDGGGLILSLSRLWVLSDPLDGFADWLGTGTTNSLRREIEQHVIRNPDDWPREHFFKTLGAFDCSSVRFGKLLETLAGPEARPDEGSQRNFVEAVNRVLRPHSLELAETGESDGYPTFTLRGIGTGTSGRPKNLIFASVKKPDLRFRDAVNNDIEIMSNEDVLVFDRPIPAEGLRWRDLQNWWADLNGFEEERAKETLYRRLLSSLPETSPPQRLLFTSYFEHFRTAVPSLPALLPEVWLHYDPKTVRERGRQALLRQRMDFLILLSAATRVVIEVDGAHHYSDGRIASPQRYGRMVAADRELRLCGYEVYRFGAGELQGEDGKALAAKFFDDLLSRHRVRR